MTSQSDGAQNRKRVYEALLTEFKSAPQLKAELGLSGYVVQNAIRSLFSSGMIGRREDRSADSGQVSEYKAYDSSGLHSLDDKLKMNRERVPAIIGRCDVAAAWVPRAEKEGCE